MRDSRANHPDQQHYHRFTGPRRLEAAMHTLHGLVQGIHSDASVNDKEVKALIQWMSAHAEWADIHPFDEVHKAVNRITADGVVGADERDDLLWLIRQFEPGGNIYDAVTSDMQRLHGFLAGIIADGVISASELTALSAWIEEHEHLKCCWPYDELESIIADIMRDGVIDAKEHEELMYFLSEFAPCGGRKAVGPLDRSYSLSGVCAICPEITFGSREFCFTGASERVGRKELAVLVVERGGTFKDNLTNGTHYLVVGADGNPCWAYACYGRKVEDAVRRRRDGQRLLIVHEYDFWDAVQQSSV